MRVFLPRKCERRSELQTRFRTASWEFSSTHPFGIRSGPGRQKVGNVGVFMLHLPDVVRSRMWMTCAICWL